MEGGEEEAKATDVGTNATLWMPTAVKQQEPTNNKQALKICDDPENLIPSHLELSAFVYPPPIMVSDLMMDTYVTSLIHSYLDKGGSRSSEFRRPLVELSRHFIHTVELHIMDCIKPVLAAWQKKRQLLYSWTSVQSTSCFFGIDEGQIRSNMKDVLPLCFSQALNTPQVDCKSLRQFTRLVAKDASAKVNGRIALMMSSTQIHVKKISKCKCIDFKTMDMLVGLAVEIIDCLQLDKCRCTPQKCEKSSTASIRIAHFLRPHAVIARKHQCDISYSTSDRAVLTILTEADEAMIDADIEQADDSVPYCDDIAHSAYSHCEDEPEDADNTVSSLAESAAMSDGHVESYKLLILVVTELLMNTMKKAQASLCRADFKRIVQNVSERALQHIKLRDITVSKGKSFNKTCEALLSDLSERFDSDDVLLTGLQQADDVVIAALRSHLTAANKKGNVVTRFFSDAGKAIKTRLQDIVRGGNLADNHTRDIPTRPSY